jgi:hypothetical protein
MSTPFSKDDLSFLTINRFVFHVVHDGAAPQLLEEVPVGSYEDFFVDLVVDSTRGSKFYFNDNSQTQELIASILDDENQFQQVSRQLATNFHAAASGSVSAGIFFFMHLKSDSNNYFAMIKYDNQPVLHYSISDAHSVSLDELTNTITRDRRALQKSALICLDNDEFQVLARDRQSSGGDIANFFKGFLNVCRAQDEKTLSRALHQAVVSTVNNHAAELPVDISREASDRFARSIEEGARNSDALYKSLFGDECDVSIRDTFDEQLRRRGIEDVPFDLDDESLRKQRRRYKTSGGITLQMPPDTQDFFEIRDCEDGSVEIVIRSQRVWES